MPRYAWLRRLGTEASACRPRRAAVPVHGPRDRASSWTLRPGAGRLPLLAVRPPPAGCPAPGIGRLPGVARAGCMCPGMRPGRGHRAARRSSTPSPDRAAGDRGTQYPVARDRRTPGLMAAVMRQSLLRGGQACIPAYPRTRPVRKPGRPRDRRCCRLQARFSSPAAPPPCSVDGRPHRRHPAPATARSGSGPADSVVIADAGTGGRGHTAARPCGAGCVRGHPEPAFPHRGRSGPRWLHGFRRRHGPRWLHGSGGRVGGMAVLQARRASRSPSVPPTATPSSPPQAAAARACGRRSSAPPASPPPCRAHRVVREKRATFAATAGPGPPPPRDRRRRASRNLALAGDWTATGLPATIEGAIRSGAVHAASALDPRPTARLEHQQCRSISCPIDQLTDTVIARPHRACCAISAGRMATGFMNSRRMPPSRRNTCCWNTTWTASSRGLRGEDRRLSAPHPGRAWRLAAVP